MRLPNLLIIGAMKSGTTSLYFDLVEHGGVFLTGIKEPHILCKDDYNSKKSLADYAKLYSSAQTDQLICDASTGYSKLPKYANIPERAVELLPDDFRVIYILRQPFDRALSHYRHELLSGEVTTDANKELREKSEFVDYSRYAYQLRPWIKAIGIDRIHVVLFEEYVNDRQRVLEEICSFLGIPVNGKLSKPAKAYNQTADPHRPKGIWLLINRNYLYRNFVRPLIPIKIRLWLSQLFLTRPKINHDEISDETRNWYNLQVAEDVTELASILGRDTLWEE